MSEGRVSMTKSGLACVYCFSCLGLLSCIELCILCRVVLFASTIAKWLTGKTYSRDIFRVEGFPLQIPDLESYLVMVYCMYLQHLTSSTFLLISPFDCDIFYKNTM